MVAAQLDLRLEMLLVALADHAVDAVGGHDQIGVREAIEIMDLGRETESHAELRAAILQDHEQGAPLGATKAVTGRAHDAVMEMEIDLIPV